MIARTVKVLGYLSAAPRVSTRANAEAAGPRAHVLGTIRGFEALNWTVLPFIVGDRISATSRPGSERMLTRGPLWTLAADFTRVLLSTVNSRRAERELADHVDWVYERFATLQALGHRFQRRSVPWILETNGLFFQEAKRERRSLILTRLARSRELRAYRQCDVLVCISDALKEMVIREAAVDPAKVLVVPNGVDTDFFDPTQYQPVRKSSTFTVGFVGAVLGWHRLDMLIDSIDALRRDSGADIHCTVVGDGPSTAELKERAARLGLAEHVTFTGQVSRDQVPPLIAGFDVGFSGHIGKKGEVVYHSPLKLYEYMSMGVPVVASSLADARDVVSAGETGFLFAPGDQKSMMQALLQAYEARDSLRAMGEKARRHVVACHSWQARVADMVARVERILSARRKEELAARGPTARAVRRSASLGNP